MWCFSCVSTPTNTGTNYKIMQINYFCVECESVYIYSEYHIFLLQPIHTQTRCTDRRDVVKFFVVVGLHLFFYFYFTTTYLMYCLFLLLPSLEYVVYRLFICINIYWKKKHIWPFISGHFAHWMKIAGSLARRCRRRLVSGWSLKGVVPFFGGCHQRIVGWIILIR